MKRLNLFLTLSSSNILLITIERFSFTGKVFLPPDNFLHLHEVFQILVLILATVVIPFFILRLLTNNFESLKTKKGFTLALLFIIGLYFYSTGNGAHEVASFIFNTFCPIKTFTSSFCKSSFINDYYFGNILYFIGAFLMYISLIKFEIMNPDPSFNKKDRLILYINSVIYAFTIFAYAAFDRVLVGLVYSLTTTAVIYYLFLSSKKKLSTLPFTLYNVVAYTLGTVASLIARFH